jgi:hypothetical protein
MRSYWSLAFLGLVSGACAHVQDERDLAILMCDHEDPASWVSLSDQEQEQIAKHSLVLINKSSSGESSWRRASEDCFSSLNDKICLEKVCGSRSDFVARILLNSGQYLVAFGSLDGENTRVRFVMRHSVIERRR